MTLPNMSLASIIPGQDGVGGINKMVAIAQAIMDNPDGVAAMLATRGAPVPDLPKKPAGNGTANLAAAMQGQKGRAQSNARSTASAANQATSNTNTGVPTPAPAPFPGRQAPASTPAGEPTGGGAGSPGAPVPGAGPLQLAQALSALQAPPNPEVVSALPPPAAPIGGLGGNVDPRHLQNLIALMQGNPAPQIPGLGQLIRGA